MWTTSVRYVTWLSRSHSTYMVDQCPVKAFMNDIVQSFCDLFICFHREPTGEIFFHFIELRIVYYIIPLLFVFNIVLKCRMVLPVLFVPCKVFSLYILYSTNVWIALSLIYESGIFSLPSYNHSNETRKGDE